MDEFSIDWKSPAHDGQPYLSKKWHWGIIAAYSLLLGLAVFASLNAAWWLQAKNELKATQQAIAEAEAELAEISSKLSFMQSGAEKLTLINDWLLREMHLQPFILELLAPVSEIRLQFLAVHIVSSRKLMRLEIDAAGSTQAIGNYFNQLTDIFQAHGLVIIDLEQPRTPKGAKLQAKLKL